MQPVSFSKPKNDFSAVLRKNVQGYFSSKNIKSTGNWKLYSKTAILLTSAIGIYLALLLADLPVWSVIVLLMVLGVNIAAIGFNIMHDGGHGSYSQKKWLNELAGYSLNLMGGNYHFWKMKHNVVHHTYTNVEGHDEDIDVWPFIRSNEHQKKFWFHRYQHIYGLFLYSITYIQWVFYADFAKYFTRKVASKKINGMDFKQHAIFWVSKSFFAMIAIVLPALFHGWLSALLCYLLASAMCGLTIATIFQLAHIHEDAAFHVPDEEKNELEHDFIIHQLQTTANFAADNRILSWLVGGLNFQVEHHLFPRISHIHYREINKVVKKVCKENNITYMEFPTFFSALRSHIRYLKIIGTA